MEMWAQLLNNAALFKLPTPYDNEARFFNPTKAVADSVQLFLVPYNRIHSKVDQRVARLKDALSTALAGANGSINFTETNLLIITEDDTRVKDGTLLRLGQSFLGFFGQSTPAHSYYTLLTPFTCRHICHIGSYSKYGTGVHIRHVYL